VPMTYDSNSSSNLNLNLNLALLVLLQVVWSEADRRGRWGSGYVCRAEDTQGLQVFWGAQHQGGKVLGASFLG
jgi:hypothetical protein